MDKFLQNRLKIFFLKNIDLFQIKPVCKTKISKPIIIPERTLFVRRERSEQHT